MRKTFFLKLTCGILICFAVGLAFGLAFGTLGRSVNFENDFRVHADILDADIPLAPVPMGKNFTREREGEKRTFQENNKAVRKNDKSLDEKVIKNKTRPSSEEGRPSAESLGVFSDSAPVHESISEPEDFLNCDFEIPKKSVFSARPIKNVLAFKVHSGARIKLALFFENTGNVPWFSLNSKCTAGPHVNLGTKREQDRVSVFYAHEPGENFGWLSNNRIAMQTPRVDPGQIGVFEFTSTVPFDADIYREFFGLVAENITWVPDSEIMIDFYVGEINFAQEEIDKKSLYIPVSMKFSELDLNGEKRIDLDLSQQKMYVHLGNVAIRVFRVSTGASATPTPTGDFNISLKQKVRIASSGTPYIMPNWQTVYKGIGIHALPSLGNAKLRAKIRKLAPDEDAPVEWFKDDSLWTEAVSHIGIPVSHGCIRLLPEDADFLFSFTDIGTPISIHRNTNQHLASVEKHMLD